MDSDELYENLAARRDRVDELEGSNPENVIPSPGVKHARIASLNDSFARPLKPLGGSLGLDTSIDQAFKLDLREMATA